MPNKEIEKQYNELRKKSRLPGFNEIDFEFEISDLEETSFLLRNIVRRIAEKLDFYTTMLEEILHPDASNVYAMHETGFFSDMEKKLMYDLYKKLMSLNRDSIEVSLGHNEKEEVEFIKSVFEEWKEIKKDLLFFVKKMKSSWSMEFDMKDDVGYLG